MPQQVGMMPLLLSDKQYTCMMPQLLNDEQYNKRVVAAYRRLRWLLLSPWCRQLAVGAVARLAVVADSDGFCCRGADSLLSVLSPVSWSACFDVVAVVPTACC